MTQKHNTTKTITAITLIVIGALLILGAVVVNGVIIISHAGWFGGLQTKNFNTAMSIIQSNPAALILTFVMFIGGGAIINAGAHIGTNITK